MFDGVMDTVSAKLVLELPYLTRLQPLYELVPAWIARLRQVQQAGHFRLSTCTSMLPLQLSCW
jgi:hypothetical protein